MSAVRGDGVIERPSLTLLDEPDIPLHLGPLEVHPGELQVMCDGLRAGLTVREFQTFWVLAQRPDRVLSRASVYALVWGGTMSPHDRSVDVFVRKVRSKLRAVAPRWAFIHTHFGIGYRFMPERLDSETAAPR
jgi:DNA-binding response OmpR family regulator